MPKHPRGRHQHHQQVQGVGDPADIPVRKWHKVDVQVAHFAVPRWTPVSQKEPTRALQEATAMMLQNKRRRGSTHSSSGHLLGPLTRRTRQQLNLSANELEEGLDALPSKPKAKVSRPSSDVDATEVHDSSMQDKLGDEQAGLTEAEDSEGEMQPLQDDYTDLKEALDDSSITEHTDVGADLLLLVDGTLPSEGLQPDPSLDNT